MDPTDQEFVVTGYVNQNYSGVSRRTDMHGGDRYVTFETDPFTRWVDLDNDGWYDYGVRDRGYGRWERFDGYTWDEDHQPPPGNDETIGGSLVLGDESGDLFSKDAFLFGNDTFHQTPPPPMGTEFDGGMPMFPAEGWFL